jgi:beta-lactam-binding protein with PASTA domain
VIAVALLLVSYIGGFASAATSVSNLLLDSSVRSGRTAFDYTYRVVVSNGTPALAAASVSVTSTVATTVVLRGVASLGNLAANSTTTSADTITLRVDRTVPFDPTKLVWTFSGTAQATVPNIVGFTSAAAGTAIGLAGLVVGDVTAASSGTVATGNIISQAPSGGTTVNAGSSVSFVVSTGPAATTVPNIVGLTATDAGTAIGSAGLIVGNVTAAASPTVPVGKVISQNPASGTTVNVGSAVNFVVSTGPASVVVPNIVGLIPADAGTAIGAAGLVVGVVTSSPSSTVPAGRIISQNPADGASVSAGSAIDFVVSTGLPNVIVPNVVGLAQAAATSSIIAAGLAVGSLTAQSSDTVADGSVISESPAANTNVPLGTAIDIVVSTGPAQPGAPPGFLQGDRAAPAFGAVADLSDDPGPVLPRYQDLGNDTSVNLGALIVSFSPTATVANVNDVLTAIQGRITRSHPGSLLFYIRISPLASLDELNALIARLQTASGVADAFPSYRGGTTGTALPGNPPYQSPAPTSLQYLYPSLGAHFFGAWNAAGSPKVAQSPIVVVADFFGAGEPSDGYAFLATNLTGFQPFTPANPAAKTPNHGYWVLSALTASFGGGSGDVDLVTGAVPFAAHVTPVNIWGELLPRADFGVEKDFAAFVDDTMRAVAAATAGGKKAILNTSLCGGCVGGGYNLCGHIWLSPSGTRILCPNYNLI